MSKTIRKLVWSKSGGRCWYCGVDLVLVSNDQGQMRNGILPDGRRYMQIDHFFPRCHPAGTDDLENLMPCCGPCNSSKNGMTIDRWRATKMRQAAGVPYFSYEQREWLVSAGFDIGAFLIPHVFWFERPGATQPARAAE